MLTPQTTKSTMSSSHENPGKAASLDDIANESLLHFGTRVQKWLFHFFVAMQVLTQTPRLWSQAKGVALLKPHKDPNPAKSYCPISLLCSTYKLYEQMIIVRIALIEEEQLADAQAGFQPGYLCCGQVANLPQYIENGFKTCKITEAVFVDLSTAYHTVNHHALLLKLERRAG